MDTLPYLLDIPPLPARYRARWEDFVVEEIPAVEPAGAGDHTWLEIEKHGLATTRAAGDLARALGVKPSLVGYAGLKDAGAVARQWLSVERVPPERALALEIPRIRVLRAVRHPRKLRRGWHRGNRFVLRLRPPRPLHDSRPARSAVDSASRDVAAGTTPPGPAAGSFPDDAVARVRAALDQLTRRGVPNYYGPQRFGYRGDTWLVGRALARGDVAEAVALIAGRPEPGEGVDIARARALFDQGRFRDAGGAWPRGFSHCARLAAAMDRTGGDPARALHVVGKPMLRLYASAWQAWLFNQVLARRVRALDRLLPGDVAWKHDTEALFLVDDPVAEQPRAEAFEISPTGPLVGRPAGRRAREPTGEVARFERQALADAGFRDADLDSPAMRPMTARRRPLRFRLGRAAVGADGAEAGVGRSAPGGSAGGAAPGGSGGGAAPGGATVHAGKDDLGPYLELRFTLPPGCYATSVLREVGRGGITEAAGSPRSPAPAGGEEAKREDPGPD
jgi:tRNA pseudouridine13 synthase